MLAHSSEQRTRLDDVIDDLLERMTQEPFDADRYAKMVGQLDRLHKMREQYIPKRVSPDTLALIIGNIVGIVLILGYERANVLTSKALGFVLRLR